MLTKVTSKNQLTLPKKALESLGFSADEEKYFDIEVKGNKLIMTPVVVTVEEKIPPAQWEKFKKWALEDKTGDVVFNTAASSISFLEKRKKK
ncbi:MAG: AbrB/MazE/SpoVT family DNA-binding domain-containing protein [Deltaproteobacteria bacterium]|nr:AbrB/MazE/SpoVT family DNA-binding domain-containing protein [Deltaproteobacteria bacterium]